LRILVAANIPDNRSGGMTRIMHFIHDRVAAAGHAVDFFWGGDAERLVGRSMGRWGRFGYPLALARHVARARRDGRPYDIVNVHEPSGAALAGRRRGGPVVVAWSHGVERRAWELALEERRLGRSGPGLKSRLMYPLTGLWQCERTLRRADHIFCLSSQDREFLRDWLRRPEGDLTRVYPGADRRYAEAAAGRDYASGERILFAGTWRKNKGIEDLVPVFASLAARNPRVSLSVLGAGAPEETVRGAFPEAVRERVRVLRAADDDEAARTLAAHDVFLLPSLFEGTPLTLMEAMMSGMPVVTTATCGMLDVIEHDRSGLLVPIRDRDGLLRALERLVADPLARRRLGEEARARALARASWDEVAKPVLAAYERLCPAGIGAR
jgi:glycosyltransferase involved in cell wall biosynthesis